jgi:hypothetical protein
VALVLIGVVADFAESVEEYGAAERILLLTLVEANVATTTQFGVLQPLERKGVRTRNGNLSTVRSALLVDWSANALRRNAQPPSQSSWSSNPFCRETSCNRVLERFLLVE